LDVSGNLLCGVSLDEYGREEGTYDATGLIALAKSISNLKELNISDNCLKAEGVKILVPALEANGSLVSLNLAKNELGVQGAKHVAEVLPEW
jgi:Ran GTPase-activating protein (RanGAP) involved in mRNA processing and transport